MEDVVAGASASRLDQPMEFRESRKEVEAMLADFLTVAPSVEQVSSLEWFPRICQYAPIKRESLRRCTG